MDPSPNRADARIRRALVPRGVTRNVVVLGLVSLFTDLSSEMIYPIIPLFVVGTLGSSPALFGLIEGIAEGISSGLRWIGGTMSDRTGRRKPFVLAGYTLSALSKPLMGAAALALGWPLFLLGRSSDRFGKSIRTAARDALIADSTAAEHRGAAFGFHRAMDTCGAVLGPLVAFAVLALWPESSLTWLFFVALAPGSISVLLAARGVREIRLTPTAAAAATATDSAHDELRSGAAAGHKAAGNPAKQVALPRGFWRLLFACGVFAIGNSSDSFLILRSKELGLTLPQVILAFALFNAVYAVTATPFGRLSDRIGRKPVLALGWLTYAAVYLGFAFLQSAAAPWGLLCLYGLYQALTDGVTKAFVSDLVPKQRRAGAIGLLGTVSGLGQLVASIVAGLLWEMRLFGGALMLALAIGAAAALIAIPLLLTLPRGAVREGTESPA